MININISRKHLLVFLIIVAIATVINYTLAQGGGVQSHPYTEIELPAGGAVWPDLNADMVDGQNATDFASAAEFTIVPACTGPGCTGTCNTACGTQTCAVALVRDSGGYSQGWVSCSQTLDGNDQCACWP